MAYFTQAETERFDRQFKNIVTGYVSKGQITQEMATALSRIWEERKHDFIESFNVKFQNFGNGAYSDRTLSGEIYSFTQAILKQMMQPQFTNMYNPYGQQPMMPPQPFGSMPFGQPMMPPPQPFGSMPFGQPVMPQYMTSMNMPSNVPQNNSVNYADSSTVKTNSQPEPVKYQEPTKPEKKPIALHSDSPDSVFGDALVDSVFGSAQVASYRDEYGRPIKHVAISVKDACLNIEEAISRAKMIYNRKDYLYHMDIKYSIVDRVEVSRIKFKEFINESKKFIESSQSATGDLKYLQLIKKLLNGYSRGDADVIEKFFMARVNDVVKHSCNLSSDTLQFPLVINDLNGLIEMSTTDSANDKVVLWQSVPNFMNQLKMVCNIAIREFVLNVKILDPTADNWRMLMRGYSGIRKIDDGTMSLDVANELLSCKDEFIAATDEGRSTMFGNAGKEFMNSVVFILGGQHVALTNIVPDMTRDKNGLIRPCAADLGGYAKDGSPNPIYELFDYFIINKTMASKFFTTIIIDLGNATLKYKCTTCSDRALFMYTV